MIKFTKDSFDNGLFIQSWDQGRIRIQGQEYRQSILLGPDGLKPWPITSFTDINAEALASLLYPEIELVLLGTGQRQQFLPVPLQAPFIQRGLGVEVMTSAAACRTWNVLLAEGRRLAAGIILGDAITPAAI